jgi:tetraacyldisaccharide 4'-kinase
MPEKGLGPCGWPLTPLFIAAVRLRNSLYDRALLPTIRVDAPVISIGNLAMGGTGKTPITRDLAERLQQLGHMPVILSRGYGRRSKGAIQVFPTDSWQDVGDEALLLARGPSRPQVWVGRDRAALACDLRRKIPTSDSPVFLLDDGFQHRRLARDLDIVLLDASARAPQPFPVGLFRETSSSLSRSDLLIFTRTSDFSPPAWAERLPEKPFLMARFEPQWVVAPDGGKLPLEWLRGRRILAACALARPTPFFQMLEQRGAQIVHRLSAPDHQPLPWERIANLCAKSGIQDVLMTEKDAVKLECSPESAILLHFVAIGVCWNDEFKLNHRLASVFSKGTP